MYLVANKLHITCPELVAAGIAEYTIRKASVRGSGSWSTRKDPMDRRQLLVAYEALRERYKERVVRHYGNPYDYLREQRSKQNALHVLLEVSPAEGTPWMDETQQPRTHILCGYVRAYSRLKDKTLLPLLRLRHTRGGGPRSSSDGLRATR